MYNFCTLFDSHYLHKGIALYKSLDEVCEAFHLYVLALDNECFLKLKSLNHKNLTVINIVDFETDELLAIKPSRNKAEYTWTCGPSMIYYFIQNKKLDHCTYLDADMMFFSSPKPIFDEIGNNSIAITEHFNSNVNKLAGHFCVQFVYFKNDENGLEALQWWKNSCIEWCFARYEDGKYGDQKYLDYFPEKFKKVCILKHRGAGVAPWNMNFYKFNIYGKIIFKNQTFDIIFFHFHATRVELINKCLVIKTITYDIIDNDIKTNIFYPYLNLLKSIYENNLSYQIERIKLSKRNIIKRIYTSIKKIFRSLELIQFIYFKVLNNRYNGYEDKKI